MTTVAVAIFVVTYLFIATEKLPRVVAALGGVAAMAVLGIVETETAYFSRDSGIDWNVIFLLFGMMIIVSVLKQTGLFEWCAQWCVRAAHGRPYRMLVLLCLVTAITSAFLDNVTTVLLVAPVTLTAARQLDVPAMPYLVALVMASNIGGAATLIGDPPNIIIASRAGLSFNDFIIHMAPVIVVIMAAFLVLCRFLFRSQLVSHGGNQEEHAADPAGLITDGRLLARCLVVLCAVMAGFFLHSALHVEPSLVAMLGAGAMVLVSRATTKQFLEEVEWETLVFFMALFILVGGLVEVGVIGRLGAAASEAMGDNYLGAATALLFGSAVLGAFVDNIPYTTAMSPIVENLVATSDGSPQAHALWWAFALGADLGGNTTAVAAGANVVVLGIAAKHGQPISFWQFTKYGVVVTSMTLVIAWVYVWLRYYTF